jgi:tight adherence protein C
MRSFLSSLKVLQEEQLKAAQIKLMQAGIRSKDAAIAVIFGRMMLPIIFGLGTVVMIYVVDYFPDWTPFKKFGATAAALIGSYKAPDIFLKNKIQKRSEAIRKGLPDALDLLVICAEAGLTVDAAFGRVAKELGKGYPELGDEFMLTSIELGFLTDRRQAFENLATRVDLDAVRGVVTTMIQTEKYGTPLASALRVLSLICFILPTLFIVILGPAACSIADNFK